MEQNSCFYITKAASFGYNGELGLFVVSPLNFDEIWNSYNCEPSGATQGVKTPM